jgi:hypothetical protein
MAGENEAEKILGGVEHVAEDIGKGVAKVFTVVDKTAKVLETVVADESTFKPALIATVTGGVKIAGDIAAAVADKGLNWTEDETLVADVEAYFKTTIEAVLVPEVEKLYGDIEADLDAPAATA